MQFTPLLKYDRFRGVLSAQLSSSQTTGTFQINNASALGTQLATLPTGYETTVTIEDEHILLSGFSVSGSTVTCTIATNGRGYNGTTAATHESDTTVEQRLNNDDVDNVNDHLLRWDDDGMIVSLGTLVTSITDANTQTIAGDYTTYFTVGRVFVYKVVSTWYRATVRSVSYGAGTTTIEVTGDGLPASGTVLSIGFEMSTDKNCPVIYSLIKQCAAAPADNPPSGYAWFYLDGGAMKFKNDAGVVSTILTDLTVTLTPTGTIAMYGGRTAPSGWLLCDGSAVSRATYANLFAILCPTIATFTVTIASPGLVTMTAHGLATGDSIYLTTTGALPTGLAINTRYWVIKNDANSFWLATSLANALAGTKINTSGSQSGTHTAKGAYFGIGDGTTTFNTPSMNGLVATGLDQAQTEFAGLGQTGGAKTHTLTTSEMPAHTHNALDGFSGAGGSGTYSAANRVSNTVATSSTGGGGAHNNIQPYVTTTYIIKT